MRHKLIIRQPAIYSETLNAWRAYAHIDKKKHYVGCYNTKLGALFAVWAYEEMHNITHSIEFPLKRRKKCIK